MATKKPTDISKHKTATTRRVVKPAASSPQAFDIIPPSRVKPSTTSRPVITATQPAVADNTLTTPPTAPTLQLRHKELTLEPPKQTKDAKAKTTTSEAEPEAPTAAATPPEPGVSVSDLIAKREQAKAEKKPETEEAAPVADKAETIEEKPAETPAVEGSEPKVEAETVKPPTVDDVKPPVTDSAKAPEEDVPEDDFMRALRDDHEPAGAEQQEHSPALKQAIKDLDEKDGRPHHELYGGKPVIVIHRDHGAKSALLWIVWFIVCVGLALLVVNLLLDAGIIQTDYNVPHTDFL